MYLHTGQAFNGSGGTVMEQQYATTEEVVQQLEDMLAEARREAAGLLKTEPQEIESVIYRFPDLLQTVEPTGTEG